MIAENRIYTLQTGQAGAYVAAYDAEGMAIQKPILSGWSATIRRSPGR
ncbi:hypothetical protein [Roseomonas chloroacetimidivorans]